VDRQTSCHRLAARQLGNSCAERKCTGDSFHGYRDADLQQSSRGDQQKLGEREEAMTELEVACFGKRQLDP